MEMDALIDSMLLFVTVAAIVGFAYDNVRGVINSKDNKDDDIRLGISIFICLVFNITIIEDLAAAELAEQSAAAATKIQMALLAIRPWLDNVISGAAMAGGAGALLGRIKSERKKVTDAAAD